MLLILLHLNSYGQEAISIERQREIRTSGRYFYGEASAFNEEDATRLAINALTQRVVVDMVQQALSPDGTELKNAVEMRAETAILSQGGRIIMLAWIARDRVLADETSEVTPEPTLEPEPDTKSKPEPTPELVLVPIPEPDTEPTYEPEPELTPEPEPEPTYEPTHEPIHEPEPEPTPLSLLPDISNPIARELATAQTLADFRRLADGFMRQGRLVYGTNRASFFNPDNCLIAVFSQEQRLIALLDVGRDERVDLLTGNTIRNPEVHFAGNSLFWIQIIGN